jgi:methylglutaconyl-CoA hydratase
MSTTSFDSTLSAPGRVLIDQRDDVLTVTLDRPGHGNELTASMFGTLAETLRAQAEKPTASVLVLRANGDSFCTGRERAASGLADLHAEVGRLIEVKRALRRSPLLTIARVQGAAKGFGLGLAILCDFAIVSSGAPLAFPEMRAGLPPAAIMAYLGEYALPRHAFPLVLFGEEFTPEHARSVGLVNDVVAPEKLDGAIDALVARLRSLDPASARACKELFGVMSQGSFDSNCRLAADALTLASATLMRRPAH